MMNRANIYCVVTAVLVLHNRSSERHESVEGNLGPMLPYLEAGVWERDLPCRYLVNEAFPNSGRVREGMCLSCCGNVPSPVFWLAITS